MVEIILTTSYFSREPSRSSGSDGKPEHYNWCRGDDGNDDGDIVDVSGNVRTANMQGSLELPGIDGRAEENKGEVADHHTEGEGVSIPDAEVKGQGSSADAHASAPSTQLGGATELVEPPRRATSKGSNAAQLGGATARRGDPGARSGTRQRQASRHVEGSPRTVANLSGGS